MTRPAPILFATVLLVAAGCGGKDNADADPEAKVSAGAAASRDQGNVGHRDSALTLGPGDMKITNEDSSVDLAVVGQQIVVRLSDKTMAQVRKETDTSAIKDSGFGGSIEKFVKRTVQSTLGQQFEYPVSDVREARYENGAIVLNVNGKEPRLLANTKVGGKKLMESFRPEDAQRFVAAVNAKKGH
jgi:hypothetical protein